MTAITEVWVVQEEDGSVASVQAEEPRARVVRDLRQLGNTVTRVEVLTPEMAAVVEAAKEMFGALYPPKVENYREYTTARDNLVAAVAVLRELEGEV